MAYNISEKLQDNIRAIRRAQRLKVDGTSVVCDDGEERLVRLVFHRPVVPERRVFADEDVVDFAQPL